VRASGICLFVLFGLDPCATEHILDFRSTDSGLIDYRSPEGAYSKGYKPITFMEFSRQLGYRQRYWARSMTAWKNFGRYLPNPAHHALADLEQMGISHYLITQV